MKVPSFVKIGLILPTIPLSYNFCHTAFAEQNFDLQFLKKLVSNKGKGQKLKEFEDSFKKKYRSEKLLKALHENSEETIVKKGGIEKYQSCSYQANNPIEDTFSVSIGCKGSLFGVFDGHSGTAASKFCRDELFSFLKFFQQKLSQKAIITKEAFIFADDCFLTLAVEEKRINDALSGACSVVAHVKDKKITVANAGDCRCVLGEKREGEEIYRAVEMTEDHQISTNESERKRLLSSHPNEKDIIFRNRIKGRLQPTRGFGDGKYKRKDVYNAMTKKPISHSWNPPYTTAEPEITEKELTNAKFMVLASDGIFDNLTSQEVIDAVSDSISESKPVCKNASAAVIERSMQKVAQSAFGNFNGEEIMPLVAIPPGWARREVHDDMTVLVVFFDESESEKNHDEEKTVFTEKVSVPNTVSKLSKLLLE